MLAQVTVKKSDSAQLLCDTNAQSVEWTRDSRVVARDKRLWIERATREDAGSYRCECSSGDNSKTINGLF